MAHELADDGEDAPATGTPLSGLSIAQARAGLVRFGPNEIAVGGDRSLLDTLREILTEPMLLLLLGAVGIYLVIGDLAEGLLLAAFAGLTVALVLYQQVRSDRSLNALRELGAPRACVIRDGAQTTIPAREVVPGDIVVLSEGERVPADGQILRAEALLVDESLLTGESVPVTKRPVMDGEATAGMIPGGDNLPWAFSGTLILRGRGFAEVTGTGAMTRAGQIGKSLAAIETEKTRLQRSTARLVRLFGVLSLLVSVAVVAIYGLVRGNWLEGVLSGIAVAMSMLPEEFPVVLTVFLAIGAWRLARMKVLARRPAVVEALGAATVLCVDKTGTLTENRMRVGALATPDAEYTLKDLQDEAPPAFDDLIEAAYLATTRASLDPIDVSVSHLAHAELADRLHEDWPLAREYGITPELLAVSQAWRNAAGQHVVATKGAPEAVCTLCGLDDQECEVVLARARDMAAGGLRVLAVASAVDVRNALPESPHDFAFSYKGLIGFRDPLRETVPAAVREARRAGISVRMITGDFPETARAIARLAGIEHPEDVLSGERLAAMDGREMERAIARTNVYARIMPEQKLRIVEALKANDEVVAMTGDGVNDAPALKAADIGIAMGGKATDVAREASGLVVLAEDFGRIVRAIRMGRRIFDNLRKVMIYISAAHVVIAGLALIPLVLGLPPLIFPAHVVLFEMIIDPMSSIAFETTPDEPDLMKRRPRPVREPVAGLRQIAFGAAQGAVLFSVCLAVYALAGRSGASEEAVRALVFIAVCAGNLALVRVNDTRELAILRFFAPGHGAFWLIAGAAAAVVAACVLHPGLAGLFAFAPPDPRLAAAAVAAPLLGVLAFDLVKLARPVQRILGHGA